jgi:hypothetical protein
MEINKSQMNLLTREVEVLPGKWAVTKECPPDMKQEERKG